MSQGVSVAFGAFGDSRARLRFRGSRAGQAGATQGRLRLKPPSPSSRSRASRRARRASPAARARREGVRREGARGAARTVARDVEAVPAPAGSGRGASVRRNIDLGAIDSFDALHVTFADLVGAARPASGRYDPSALVRLRRIAHRDRRAGDFGRRGWATFASRAAFVCASARAGARDAGASMSNNKVITTGGAVVPHAVDGAPARPRRRTTPHLCGLMHRDGRGAGAGGGPATMAMLMSMFVAASGNAAGGTAQAGTPFSAAVKAEDAPPAWRRAVTGGAVFFTKSSPGRAPSSERAHAPRTHVYHQYPSRRDVETLLRPPRGVGAETTRVVTHTYYLVARSVVEGCEVFHSPMAGENVSSRASGRGTIDCATSTRRFGAPRASQGGL